MQRFQNDHSPIFYVGQVKQRCGDVKVELDQCLGQPDFFFLSSLKSSLILQGYYHGGLGLSMGSLSVTLAGMLCIYLFRLFSLRYGHADINIFQYFFLPFPTRRIHLLKQGSTSAKLKSKLLHAG